MNTKCWCYCQTKISTFAERISSLGLGCLEGGGGVFGADGLAGRPMAPSRLQVDVSESTNSVVAPIACPQAGCL